jgi:hypothetical protein
MFKKMANNRPFLKLALEGFAGDGKTFTAAKIAIGLHQMIGSKKPIAIFDTEKASKALNGLFKAANIEAVVADEHRSLKALSEAMRWCEEGNADILLVDSITHVWEEFLNAYSQQTRHTRLEFQDWAVIKPRWKQEFSTPFVNAKIHIIFTGRAGYEYSQEVNERTGKKEIQKTGIKMKAETETAFEPDILVLMEKQMKLMGETKSVTRQATIIKDRTDMIDGKTFTDPSFQDFYPAIAVLLDGISVDSTSARIEDKFDDPDQKQGENRHKRERIISEIEGNFKLVGWGTGAKDQQFKAATLRKVWNVVSIDALDGMPLTKLETGLAVLNGFSEAFNAWVEECKAGGEAPDMSYIPKLLDKEMARLGIGAPANGVEAPLMF